ncbi:aromatic-ring-hydroxylating dioxygenase subunit beta [soil metagenome]|nr:aromatic-ring-hydroxylating dioxygenase subunit beta [Acidimicrobiia bacterium]
MTALALPEVDVAPGSALWARVQDLFAEYVECLDDDELERWPELFTETCLYQVIARENHDRGLPLAAILCESRGMLEDRVVAVRETSMYAPRYLGHVVGPARLRALADGTVAARAGYAVFRTLAEEETRVFNTGRYLAVVETGAERLRFRELRCVYDSTLIPNSIVSPV